MVSRAARSDGGSSLFVPAGFREAAEIVLLSHGRAGGLCITPARPLSLDDLVKRGQQPVYLVGGVVVGQANAQRPTGLLQPQPLHQRERVVIAVPAEDPALAQRLRQRAW